MDNSCYLYKHTGEFYSFAHPSINLNAYMGNATFYIRFKYNATYDYYWAIDNVTLSGTCSLYNYNWTSTPSGYTSSIQNPTGVTPNVTTNYTINYTIPANGCSNSANTSVVVNYPPTITIQPVSPAGVCNGTGTPTFTLTASGTNLSYQWQANNVNITNSSLYSGANTNTLTLTNPTYSMNGYNYRCVISGVCSPVVTSSSATLTVYGNLTSGVIGNSQTICYNTTPSQLSFTTLPTGGTGTYTYQWYNTSGLISGATNSTYSPSSLTSSTTYYCASDQWKLRNSNQQ